MLKNNCKKEGKQYDEFLKNSLHNNCRLHKLKHYAPGMKQEDR
jgi:hypothetical protein